MFCLWFACILLIVCFFYSSFETAVINAGGFLGIGSYESRFFGNSSFLLINMPLFDSSLHKFFFPLTLLF